MDKIKEMSFINGFIESHKKERLLFELNSKDKRLNAILQMSKYIKKSCILFSSNKAKDDDLKALLLKYVKSNALVYLLSPKNIDGQLMGFDRAFNTAIYDADSYIIICDDRTVFIKSEVEYGSPMKYILRN